MPKWEGGLEAGAGEESRRGEDVWVLGEGNAQRKGACQVHGYWEFTNLGERQSKECWFFLFLNKAEKI